MNIRRQLLAGVGLAALAFGAGCGGDGVSLGSDDSRLRGSYEGDSGGGGGPGGGEARAPVAEADLLKRLSEDAASLDAATRGAVRYVSLHSFYNDASVADGDVRATADAVSALVNHLATRQTDVKRPAALSLADGGVPFALRVDLRDYDLTADDWALIERGANVLPRAAGCSVPLITAEQFLGAAGTDEAFDPTRATFESVYSNIVLRRSLVELGVLAGSQLVFDPIGEAAFIAAGFHNFSDVKFADLAKSLGVDVTAETANPPGPGSVVRACARISPESSGPFCLQRHDRPGQGNLWWSMVSFSAPAGPEQDPFASPIGPAGLGLEGLPNSGSNVNIFRTDGGNVVFTLPNGLAAVASFDDNFALLSSPPSPGAGSPGSGVQGFLARGAGYVESLHDELRDAILGSVPGFTADEVAFVYKLVPPQEQLDATFTGDRAAYQGALAGTFYGAPPEPGALPFNVFEQDVPLARVAATLGLTVDALLALIDANPDLVTFFAGQPPSAPPADTVVSRETFVLLSARVREILAPPTASLLNSCAE
jgi:hypothetical protein